MPVILAAANVPPPMVPSEVYLIADALDAGALAPHSPSFNAAQVIDVPYRLNAAMVRLDLMGRYGGGGNAICYGLDLNLATGMDVDIAAGLALIDAGFVEAPAAQSVSISTYGANHRVWLWLRTDGAIEQVDDSLTPPAQQSVLLGSALINGTNNGLTSLDTSGVLSIRGGVFERSTADTGIPADTPNAALRFWTLTTGGRYYWNGSHYERAMESGRFLKAMPDSNYTLVAPEFERRHLVFTGTLGATRDVVLPLRNGAEYVVVNQTTQSLVVKGASGASVTVATNKTAIVRCDGTDYVRVTADV